MFYCNFRVFNIIFKFVTMSWGIYIARPSYGLSEWINHARCIIFSWFRKRLNPHNLAYMVYTVQSPNSILHPPGAVPEDSRGKKYFRWILSTKSTTTWKIKIAKLIFWFVSTHCASSIKIGPFLRGGRVGTLIHHYPTCVLGVDLCSQKVCSSIFVHIYLSKLYSTFIFLLNFSSRKLEKFKSYYLHWRLFGLTAGKVNHRYQFWFPGPHSVVPPIIDDIFDHLDVMHYIATWSFWYDTRQDIFFQFSIFTFDYLFHNIHEDNISTRVASWI